MIVPEHPSAVLFDLDGTITDSAPGVIASMLAALDTLGVPAPPQESLRAVVGPPLAWTFEHIAGVAPEQIDRAQDLYRAHYSAGSLFNAEVFPGIRELLVALHAAGVPIALATSKSVEFAERILDHFTLTEYFTAICGAQAKGRRSEKALVIADALAALTQAGAGTEHAVMVGDREHDLAGAAAHHLPCILVTWGYGEKSEHERADAVVDSADGLAAALGVELLNGPASLRSGTVAGRAV